jgi:hypothetical protein
VEAAFQPVSSKCSSKVDTWGVVEHRVVCISALIFDAEAKHQLAIDAVEPVTGWLLALSAVVYNTPHLSLKASK